ncbi:unknown [Coraliomargarita sp. CAG:312]|nr:unknown [Coraliomargarita sp. CAG:312]
MSSNFIPENILSELASKYWFSTLEIRSTGRRLSRFLKYFSISAEEEKRITASRGVFGSPPAGGFCPNTRANEHSAARLVQRNGWNSAEEQRRPPPLSAWHT